MTFLPNLSKKAKKQEEIRLILENFIAEHEQRTWHYLKDSDIIKTFYNIKPELIKRILKDLR